MNANIEIPTEDGDLVCVICYDKIGTVNDKGEREQPVQLDCQHVFGNICLDFWLTKKRRCPICRATVHGYMDSSDESDFSGSEASGSSEEEEEEDSDEDSDEESDENEETGQDSDGETDSEDDEADGGDGGSHTSEISGLSDISDMSEVSQLSINAGGEGEDMIFGTEALELEDDDDMPNEFQSRHPRFSAQEMMNRLSSNTVTRDMMTGFTSGVLRLASAMRRPRNTYDDSTDEDISGDES